MTIENQPDKPQIKNLKTTNPTYAIKPFISNIVWSIVMVGLVVSIAIFILLFAYISYKFLSPPGKVKFFDFPLQLQMLITILTTTGVFLFIYGTYQLKKYLWHPEMSIFNNPKPINIPVFLFNFGFIILSASFFTTAINFGTFCAIGYYGCTQWVYYALPAPIGVLCMLICAWPEEPNNPPIKNPKTSNPAKPVKGFITNMFWSIVALACVTSLTIGGFLVSFLLYAIGMPGNIGSPGASYKFLEFHWIVQLIMITPALVGVVGFLAGIKYLKMNFWDGYLGRTKNPLITKKHVFLFYVGLTVLVTSVFAATLRHFMDKPICYFDCVEWVHFASFAPVGITCMFIAAWPKKNKPI